MFETLKSVFKVKEMRRKLLYVWMILVIRIGSQLPIPGVDSDVFKQWFELIPVMHSISLMRSPVALLPDVSICIEHHTVHYFFHYHSASYNCNSCSGGNAQRW